MKYNGWFVVGAMGALAAVAAGAFGDHLVAGKLEAWYPEEFERRLANWQTASRYLFFHAIGCCLIGLLPAGFSRSAVRLAGGLFVAGMLLFSGGLLIYSLFDLKWLVRWVPIGGASFMGGWIALAIGGWLCRKQMDPAS